MAGDAQQTTVRCYLARVEDARAHRAELFASIMPRFAEHAQRYFNAGTKPAETGGLCELAAGGLLARVLGFTRDEQLTIGTYGKPAAADGSAFFNISHSDGVVVLGVADEEVGVDVEGIPDELRDLDVMALGRSLGMPRERKAPPTPEMRALAPTPDAWAREWTRLEAILKGIGTGFGVEPAEYLPRMGEWQCAWEPLGADMLCCATRSQPQIELIEVHL